MHQNVTNITLKKNINWCTGLRFYYAIEKPTNLYIQDLNIDTENDTRHLYIKILIAMQTRKITIQKLKHNKHFTQKTITCNKTNS